MREPVDNPISDEGPVESMDGSPEIGVASEGALPEIFRGRMFCVAHGRQCYRSRGLDGENVWVCPDERHVRPVS